MVLQHKLVIRQVGQKDAEAFRKIRLESLWRHPENFVSSYKQEKREPLSYFKKILSSGIYIGCFDGEKILGICGIIPRHTSPKMTHAAILTGFYISPRYRGRGFARKLMDVVLSAAAKKYEKLILHVNSRNYSAHRLYKASGFKDVGLDRKSLKIGRRYIDEFIMVKFLK